MTNQEWQELQSIIENMRKMAEERKAGLDPLGSRWHNWRGFELAVHTFEMRVQILHPNRSENG